MNKTLISIFLAWILISNLYAQKESKYIITPHLGLSQITGDNDLNKFYSTGVCFGLGGGYLLNESVSFHLNGTYHFSSFSTLGFEEEMMKKYEIEDRLSPFVLSNGTPLHVLDFHLETKYTLSHQYVSYFPYIKAGIGITTYSEGEKEFSATNEDEGIPGITEIFEAQTKASLAYSLSFGVDFFLEKTPLFLELNLQFGTYNDQTIILIPVIFGLVF
jgi:hypothetical protein